MAGSLLYIKISQPLTVIGALEESTMRRNGLS